MKKALKIVGIIFGAIIGLFGVAAAVAAISGAFSHPEIKIESLSWEVDKIRVVDDFQATVNFLPENANQLDVELNLVYAEGSNVVEYPSTIKAGQPFTIKLKKDANGNNVGGEVVLQAKTQLVVSQTNLKILVDVPIPNNGLTIASDFDSQDEQNILDAGASDFSLYVFTNPVNALNPNTGSDIDLNVAYKNIELKSADTSKLQILDTGETKTGFYCPNYIAHGHTGPFKDINGNEFTTTTCPNGSTLIPYKYIKYGARALESTQAPVIVTAKALRTYDMQDKYVDKSDSKYYSNGEMTSEGRQQFLTDLSNYVQEFQDYLKTDTRVNYDSINTSTVNYQSGAAFIEAVTQTNSNGESYIKIEDNRVHEEAAYFYLFVESRTLFNIEQIEIADVQSSYETSGRQVEFNLFDEVQQYNVSDLKSIFDISLKPTSDEFSSSDLEHRLKEIKVMAIMNKKVAEGEEDPHPNYDFAPNGYVFEIENPTSKDTPVWKIRCINPISESDKQRSVRLRFYVPSSDTGEYTIGDPYADVPVQIVINDVNEFKLYDTGSTALATQMVTNTEDVNGASYRQVLDSSRYVLTGEGSQAPTYTTVKFFVTKDSAKTKNLDGSDTAYFKANLSGGGSPKLLTMTYGESSTIEAYEISHMVAGQNYLEAINVTNGNPLQVFAAVIKTDHNGKALDTAGRPEGDPEFNGNYQIIRQSSNTISISINSYLEKLNFYTISSTGVYSLRNVPETGGSNVDTVQLLADQMYTLKASPYELTDSGEFNAQSPLYSNSLVDYQSNLKWATDYAYNGGLIKFGTDSNDINLQENNYDTNTASYSLVIVAEINKNASAGHVTEAFDFRALSEGILFNTFSSTRSTVNMIVNYAKIEEFNITNSTDQTGSLKDYYIISPMVGDPDSDESIIWRDANAGTTKFDINHNFVLDIQKTTPNGQFNSKIDSCYGSQEYLDAYVNLITNPQNTDAIEIKWDLQFDYLTGYWDGGNQISGAITADMKVEDYISITEQTYAYPGTEVYFSKPQLQIKKGTPEGVFIKATCTLNLYKTNTGYIESKSAVINLIIKQSEVQFEMYSPLEKQIDNKDVLVVNQAGEYAGFVLEGGGNDGTLDEGYDLLADYGTSTSKRDVYEWKDNDYVKVEGKSSYNLINVILDDDGELAGWCTYVINDVTNSPIYFKNEAGEKTYTATPKKVTVEGKTRFQLVVYAEHISSSRNATITVTDPFGDKSQMYNVHVRSSITLSKTTSDNISTRTTATDGGKIDLTTYFKATQNGVELPTKFTFLDDEDRVVSNNIYATITEGKYLIPKEVLTNKTIKIAMYYTLEGVDTLVTRINNNPLAVLVTPGYQIEVNSEIQNAEAKKFSINSGVEKDFYNEYATSPDDFIKIKNIETGNYISSDSMEEMLSKLIQLSFDEESLSENDLAIFNTLFRSSAEKNAINNGELITKAITNNITLPIRINFMEGMELSNQSQVGNPTYIATFYIEIKASVVFAIKKNNVEQVAYNETGIVVDGQELSNTQIGHVYSKINVDTDADGQINLGDYNITIFDSSQTTENNILTLSGDDGVELLNSSYESYALYRFDASKLNYQEVTGDYHVSVVTTTNENGLSTLVLNIKNAVNEMVYYKLAIKTSINKEGESFDYYFAIVPTYQLKVNYPLEVGPEKITPGATIDLNANFINTNNRYQVYRIYDTVEYIYSIAQTDTNNLYQLSTSLNTINQTVLLSDAQTPITLSVVGGSGYAKIVDTTKVEFLNPEIGSQIVTIRITLFNGAYIDYQFEVFATLTIPIITINDGSSEAVSVYAGKSVNIMQYIKTNATPDNFRYIIKYNDFTKVEAKVGDNNLDNPNQIIEYSGNELLVYFEDVEVETLVSFGVWHTYSVNGNQDSQAVLNIKLLPNLQVQINKDADGKQIVNQLVAGVQTQIISKGSSTWLKIANESYEGITVELTSVDGQDYVVNPEGETDSETENTNWLGVEIAEVIESGKVVGYTFKSANVGVARNLVFTITKTGDLTYHFNFEIKLVPNINLHSAHITGTPYSIVGAAGSDDNGRVVALNTLDGVFAPTDFAGNALNLYNATTNPDGNVEISAYFIDAQGNQIITTPEDYALLGANFVGVTLNVTLAPVNKEQKVFIKIVISWKGQIEPYEAVLSLTVLPNLSSDHVVQYTSSEGYLPVFAGSTIELDFSQTLTIAQGSSSATVYAKQTDANGSLVNTNVVLNIDAHSNSTDPVYYELYEEYGKYYIFFRGVPSVQIITIPVYYDLTGEIKGLKSSADNIFNDEKIIYNPNRSIKIRISPSMAEIGYATSDTHAEESAAINMTEQLMDVYANEESILNKDEESILNKDEEKKNLTGSDLNLLATLKKYYTLVDNSNSENNKFYNVNGYLILDLFSFAPSTGVTFDSTDPTKIYSNLKALYSSLTYSVTGKIGRAEASTDTWNDIERPDQYYFVDKENGIFYIIPPKQVGAEDTILLKVVIQLPGQSGSTASSTVYFKLQFAGDYKLEKDYTVKASEEETTTTTIPKGTIVKIGLGGEIVNTYSFAQPTGDEISDSSSYGINLNKTTTDGNGYVQYISEYNLNDYFMYGYLLRSYTDTSSYYDEINLGDTGKRARRGYDRYEYYMFDNIKLSFSFVNAGDADFASLQIKDDGNTYLIPNVYFEQSGKDSRSILLQVTAGSISKNYRVYIHPRSVTHNFEITESNYEFTYNLTVNPNGSTAQLVDVYSNEIEILKSWSDDDGKEYQLTDEEYQLVTSWLTFNTLDDGTERRTNFKFTPDLKQLKSEITVRFKNTISVDSAQTQIFEKYYNITLEPTVGLTFNKSAGVKPELSEKTIELYVGANSTESLFKTKIFDLSKVDEETGAAEYTIVSFTFAQTSQEANYNTYVQISSGNSEDSDVDAADSDSDGSDTGLMIYTITENSKLVLLPNQILLNVSLPYTATLTFTDSDGKTYTLTHSFNLIIVANAGVQGLKDSYTASAGGSGQVTIDGDNLGSVEVIGTGVTISFEVLSENLSTSGGAVIDASEINNLILINFNYVANENDEDGRKVVTSITIDFTEMFETYSSLTSVNGFYFNVIYTVGDTSTTIKTIWLTILDGTKPPSQP